MSASFTVITTASHHFGDREGVFEKEDPGVTFVGASHTVEFEVPGVDAGQATLLMFRSFNVNFRNNVLTVNGQTIDRAIARSVEKEWKMQMVVLPPGLVKAGKNSLNIETRASTGEKQGNLDDFLVKDVVLWFQPG